MSRTATVLIASACMLLPAAAASAQTLTSTTTTTTTTATTTATTTTTTPTVTSPTKPPLPPSNQRADKAALSAYVAYLQAVITNSPLGKLAETTFATTTVDYTSASEPGCKDALEPIASAQTGPTSSKDNAALYAIGEEIGADATVTAYTATTKTAFPVLATALTGLRWLSKSAPPTIKHFLAAEKALIALIPSNLCGDALDVVSETGTETMAASTETTSFLTTYDADTAAVNATLKGFMKLLGSYETSSDHLLATELNSLAIKVTNISTKTIKQGASQLETDLGLS